jgi:hypothetical protein
LIEASEAQRRPGSNLPPIIQADRDAHSDRIRARITTVLNRAQIIHPDSRPMVRDIIAAWRAHTRRPNVAETALEQILTLVDDAEQLRVQDTTLKELDALAPIRILCNAIRDALAGKPATFLAMLPKPDDPSVDSLPATTGALTRACVSVGLAVLTLGKAQRGGISRDKAKQEVRDAFRKEGIDFTADTALEWAKRLNRGDDPDARAQFDEIMVPVIKAAATHWSIKERRVALKRLADVAGRKLET